jgi:hypothetical protein
MLMIPPHRILCRPVLANALVVAALYAGWTAHAQTPSCEQFKAKLMARIAVGPGPFHLTSVPSGETIPVGGRVVGNCGGGKWTLVLLAGVAVPPNLASAPVREPRGGQPPEQIATPPSVVSVDAQPPMSDASELPPAIASESMPTPVQSAAPASTAPSTWNPPAFETLMWVAGVAVSLVLVLVVAARWIAYRLRYDAAGLPRGPRLR